MQYPPHILQSRVEALKAELDREREALPTRLLAFVAAFLSLFSLGASFGFNSLAFVLSAFVIAGFTVVVGIGAWGLRSNLRDSTAALEQSTS
ncbi:hypothetical protein OKW11_006295 [Pseudomonas baetica]|nr:hypothetical protein [Pseudomonas baetica]